MSNSDNDCEGEGNIEYLTEWPVTQDDTKSNKTDAEPAAKKSKIVTLKDDEDDSDDDSEDDDDIDAGVTARMAVAVWHRRRQRSGNAVGMTNTAAMGARSAVNVIARTDAARRFLARRTRRLQRMGDSVDGLVLASHCDLAGEFERAEEALVRVVGRQRRLLDDDGSLDHAGFLGAVAGLADDVKESLWLLAKVRLSLKAKETLPQTVDTAWMDSVPRVANKDLSVEEFQDKYLRPGLPVVITGLLKEVLPGGANWSIERMRRVLEGRKIPLKRSDPESSEWARLEFSREGTVAELLASEALYLFDWSLPLFCPELEAEFAVPSYFRRDFLKMTSPDALYRKSWPSLFLAPSAAVGSALHVDAFASHFWMFLFEGRKRWTFFPRSAVNRLGPVYAESLDPVFEADIDAPELADVGRREVVLNPGECLFVPQGSPHKVDNLEATLAVSGNFVDESNAADVAVHLRLNALQDPRAGDLLRELVGLKLV